MSNGDSEEIHVSSIKSGTQELTWSTVVHWFSKKKGRMPHELTAEKGLLDSTSGTPNTTPNATPDETELPQLPTTKVYKRRWIMLGLFCLYSMSNAYQWIHLNIIYDVILTYYNSSLPEKNEQKALAIDWLSMIYMLCYIPLIFPATWLLDRKGLRIIGILGCFLNCLGAWLKCAAVSPDRFYLLLIAQTICAIAQVFILGMPARLAAVWFGPRQVSTATAIGVFGNQLGCALGFLIPPQVVKIQEDLSMTGTSLSHMFYAGAGFTTLLFILVVIVFKKEPPLPPSIAQMKILQSAASENYMKSLVRLLKNVPFILLVCSYGMNVGVYYAIGTLLNPIIFGYFDVSANPRFSEDAGWIGSTLVLAGLLGSLIAGLWLDKTKLFKLTTIIIYFLSLASLLTFTFTLYVQQIWIVYLTAGLLGTFMTGYLPVGFEFAAELTYPESEGTSSGLLNASAQMFGIILTLAMGQLMRLDGSAQDNIRNANLCGSGILLLGCGVTIAIKNNLLRQNAEKNKMEEATKEEPTDKDINREEKLELNGI